jgi:DNA-binding beta-propeller fold protein YncE
MDSELEPDGRPDEPAPNEPAPNEPGAEPGGPAIVEPPPINVAANHAISRGPMDATPSPDGREVYYTALLQQEGASLPAVFHVPADGGEPVVLASSEPLVAPVGIATSLNGERLFVADSASGTAGAILTLASRGGEVSVLAGTAGFAPAGLMVAPIAGQERLYFTGRHPETGQAGVFSIGTDGGQAQLQSGDAELIDPGGVAVTRDGVIYTVDTLGSGELASVLRIERGRAQPFVEGIGVGFPAGLTLTLDDATVIVSGIEPSTRWDIVYFIDAHRAELAVMKEPVSAFFESAGLHRAHDANVFAWADSEANDSGTVYVLKP